MDAPEGNDPSMSNDTASPDPDSFDGTWILRRADGEAKAMAKYFKDTPP